MALLGAIIDGEEAAILEILGRDPEACNKVSAFREYKGVAPLHLAVKFGQLNTVALLVERGADLEVKDVAHDSSPLGWAAFFGNAEISRHLVEMGADVNHECNPLYYALRGREGEWSEFSSATSDEYEAVVQILKAHGAQEEPPKT